MHVELLREDVACLTVIGRRLYPDATVLVRHGVHPALAGQVVASGFW